MKDNVLIKIELYCSECEEKFRTQDLAIQHVQKTKHLISFSGSIKPNNGGNS